MAKAKKVRSGYMNAYDIAKKLEALDKMDDITVYAPMILDIMKGCPGGVWQELDEKPGKFGYMSDRFYMLRSVRNHPVWGEKLFAGFV